MNAKLLREVAEESRDKEDSDLLPFPDQFARCMAEITGWSKGHAEAKKDKPTAFVTTSGLRFVLSDGQ